MALSVLATQAYTAATNTSANIFIIYARAVGIKSMVFALTIYDTSATDGAISSVAVRDSGYQQVGTPTKVDEYYDATCDGHVSIWYINESDLDSGKTLYDDVSQLYVVYGGTCTDVMGGHIELDTEVEVDATATEATGNGSPTITWSTTDPDTICVSAALSDQSVGTRITCNDTSVYVEDLGSDTGVAGYAIRTSSGSQTIDWTDTDNDEDWVAVGASFTKKKNVNSSVSAYMTGPITVTDNNQEALMIGITTPTTDTVEVDFEEGDLSDFDSTTGTITVGTSYKMAGKYGGMLTLYTGTHQEAYGTISDVTGLDSGFLWISFWVHPQNFITDAIDYINLLAIDSSTGTKLVRMYLVDWNSSSTANDLSYDVGVKVDNQADTALISFWASSYSILENAPNHIGLLIVRESYDGAADGYISGYINGYNDPTNNSYGLQNYNAYNDFDNLKFGLSNTGASSTLVTQTDIWIDDLFIATGEGRPLPYNYDNIPAYIKGGVAVSDNIPAYIEGESTGTDTSDNQAAYMRGSINTSDNISAYMRGSIDTSDNQEAYLRGSINTSDNESAYLRGSIDTTDNQEAYLRGQDTATDNREAWLAGGIETTDNQEAYIHGVDTATDNREAWISGGLVVTDNQIAFIQGIIGATDNKSAYLVGSESASDNIEAYTKGKDDANDNQEAYVRGSVDSSAQVPAYLHGSQDTSANLAGYVAGQASTSDNIPAYLRGQETASDSNSGYIHGQESLTDNIPAFISGGINVTDSIEAYTKGQDTAIDNKYAYLRGQLETSSSKSAYLVGSVNVSDNVPAYMEGGATLVTDNVPAYIAGIDTASDNIPAYIQGYDTASDNREAYIEGFATAVDNKPAYLVGSQDDSSSVSAFIDAVATATDNKSAYLAGVDTAIDNIPAFIHGVDTATDSVPAFTSGGLNVNSNVPVFTIGQDTASDSKSAYMVGSVETSDSKYAYVVGVDTDSSSIPAYLRGKVDTSDNIPAYLVGSIDVTDNQPAYVLGSDNVLDNVPAYMLGYEIPWHDVCTVVVNTGSIVSGTRDDTWSNDDNELVLGEVASTPGYSYDFYFGCHNDVPTTSLQLFIYGYYDGNPAHNVKLQQYNFNLTQWDNVTANSNDFPQAGSEQIYWFSLLDDANYLDNGEIRLRIIHTSTGNPAHQLHIDWMHLDYLGLDAAPAYIRGSVDTTSNIPAYMRGQDTQTDNIPGYIVGGVNVTSNVPAYMLAIGEWLYPDADITVNTWKREDEGTSNLYVSIDEDQPSDSDYVYHAEISGTEYFEVRLSDPTGGNVGDGDVTIWWRGKIIGSGTVTMRVQLREGAALIAENDEVFTTGFANYTYTLTSGEKASITDWTDLRLRFIVQGVV